MAKEKRKKKGHSPLLLILILIIIAAAILFIGFHGLGLGVGLGAGNGEPERTMPEAESSVEETSLVTESGSAEEKSHSIKVSENTVTLDGEETDIASLGSVLDTDKDYTYTLENDKAINGVYEQVKAALESANVNYTETN